MELILLAPAGGLVICFQVMTNGDMLCRNIVIRITEERYLFVLKNCTCLGTTGILISKADLEGTAHADIAPLLQKESEYIRRG